MDNLPAGSDTPDAPFNQDDSDQDWETKFYSLKRPYDALEDAFMESYASIHKESLAMAMLNKDWCKVGKLVGYAAEHALLEAINHEH